MGVLLNIGRNGERAAEQRKAARLAKEQEQAEREQLLREKTIVLADARAARTEE